VGACLEEVDIRKICKVTFAFWSFFHPPTPISIANFLIQKVNFYIKSVLKLDIKICNAQCLK